MFNAAIKDPKLLGAIERLKLGEGSTFSRQLHAAKANPLHTKKVRLFYAEGPKGGVYGILLADSIPFRGASKKNGTVGIGVYITPKMRRKGIASSLVAAVRAYYPTRTLISEAWNKGSLLFWHSVVPITKSEPVVYDCSLNNFLPENHWKYNDITPLTGKGIV